MRERVVERPYDDEKQWTEYKRDDVKRALRDRGWTPENAATVLDGIPDEVFQIIRAQGVEELAECYIDYVEHGHESADDSTLGGAE